MTSSTGSTAWNGNVSRRVRLAAALLLACTIWLAAGMAHADSTLNPSLLPEIQSATFEVVAAKPKDTLTYEKPLPMDLLPYQERTDKYYSIGTAFAIGPNTYVTAAHVLMIGYQSLWGPPELRDASGKVYAIDKIEKFALRRDFVVFSLKDPPRIAPLAVDTKPGLNHVVYSVGNALGTGVVIRNGLYTSDTPEAQDGQWKWIRFSAAASPGNSGGPLLDQDGKVIGVVLMKSPNENLNYALPMRDVLDAPRDLARFDRRMAYQFDVFDSTLSGTFKGEFKLPLPVADFFAAYAKAFHPYLDSQLKALLDQQSANLFPNGDGSHQLLFSGPTMDDFPQLVARNSDGVWGTAGRSTIKITLPANGYIAGGVADHNILFHLRKPDNIPDASFHHDPKRVMDMLLKTGFLKRSVGPERILVTSLGDPGTTGTWSDRWGRHWQVWRWPVPYADGYVSVFALPTPDGYAMLMRIEPATSRHDTAINMQAITDFVSLPYDGTLAQWKAFLADPKLLPDAFKNIHVAFDYGKGFHYDSQRLAFSFTPDLQEIDAGSVLTLGFTFFPGQDGKVVWDVGQVWLAEDNHDHHWVSLLRNQTPPPDLDDSYQSFWKKVAGRQHPYDGMSYSDSDMTKINAVVPPAQGDAKPSVLYTAYVYQPGTQPQVEMKQKLDSLLKNVRVKEQ
ncbi:MAG TPA: trypsin-like peptidase domain-containing protein [Rhodanobacteraceae bacterium]|nr:trypsin-like peptidase domain-containing protein [Rhodanobacteraceae bacterium]